MNIKGLKYIHHIAITNQNKEKVLLQQSDSAISIGLLEYTNSFTHYTSVLNKDALAAMVHRELYAQSLRAAAKVKGNSKGLKAKARSFSHIQ